MGHEGGDAKKPTKYPRDLQLFRKELSVVVPPIGGVGGELGAFAPDYRSRLRT